VTITDQTPPADSVEPAHRGVLVVTEQAVQHLVEGVIENVARNAAHPKVSVDSLTDDGAELTITLAIDYPRVPLSGVLAEMRHYIAAETSRHLGRPVRSIDLTISDFVTTPAAAPRVI
jgi:hypothetical protein